MNSDTSNAQFARFFIGQHATGFALFAWVLTGVGRRERVVELGQPRLGRSRVERRGAVVAEHAPSAPSRQLKHKKNNSDSDVRRPLVFARQSKCRSAPAERLSPPAFKLETGPSESGVAGALSPRRPN